MKSTWWKPKLKEIQEVSETSGLGASMSLSKKNRDVAMSVVPEEE